MSKTKQKIYPAEFKESAIKLAIESKHSIAQTARELGINTNTLYTWIDKYSKPRKKAMRTDEHIYDEVEQLKKGILQPKKVGCI
jgi:transposase